MRDEALAHRLGDFQQDLAVAVGLDQVPHAQTPVERQRLEDVGDVGRMQRIERLLQLGLVLLVDQRLHQIVARPHLSMDELFHELLLVQQLDDVLERVVHALVGFRLFDLRHGTLRLLARADDAAAARASKRSFYGARHRCRLTQDAGRLRKHRYSPQANRERRAFSSGTRLTASVGSVSPARR